MRSLKIRNFKAFGDDEVELGEVTRDNRPMNILCYGENGAGKSSLFEAIKYVFHQQRLRRERNISHLQDQALANALQQMKLDYAHKNEMDFEITINGVDWNHFNTTNYHVYLINGSNLLVTDHIDVDELLKSAYLGYHDIDNELTADAYEMIVEEVNRSLEDNFFEDVRISRSQNGQYRLMIDDAQRDLHSDSDIHKVFNEAKIHLIALLLILSGVEILAPHGQQDKKLLVLDDFITSLDMANRSFLYQYIISKFNNFQILIFTHNTSFFNLCDFFIGEDPGQRDKWVRQGVYEYNHHHKVYSDSRLNSVDKLKRRLHDHPGNVITIGNDVRQYFEVLLHELSMLLMAGAKEETTAILSEITKKADRRFFHIEGDRVRTVKDLTDSVMNTMDNVLEDRQFNVIRRYVSNFRGQQDTDKLSENLKAMTIYQKVALHQSSHGHAGLPNLSAQEIKASLVVMKKIEDTINKMKVERI